GLRREYLRSYAEFFETIVGAAEVGVKSEVLSWIGEQRDRDQEDVVVSAAAMVCIDQCQRTAEIKNLGQIRTVVVEIVSSSGDSGDRDEKDVVVRAAPMVGIAQCKRAAEIKNLGQIRKVVVEIVSISGIRGA